LLKAFLHLAFGIGMISGGKVFVVEVTIEARGTPAMAFQLPVRAIGLRRVEN
jgi:hypothetical protein